MQLKTGNDLREMRPIVMRGIYKRQQGFTLIEVIVTAVIIAILAAVGIPLYRGYITDAHNRDAHARAEMIGAAILQRHNQGVSIDASSGNGWTQISIVDPSDSVFTYVFDDYPAGANDPDFHVEITGFANGPMNGFSLAFYPYLSGSNRWQ